MIILDIIICGITLFFGFKFKNKFKIFNVYDREILNKLFIFHVFIGVLFFFYILNYGGDSTNYWYVTYYDSFSLNDVLAKMNASIGSATGYMLLLNYFPAKILNLSFFTGSFLYSMLGYLGFVYFYAIVKENIPNLYWLKKIKVATIPIFPLLLFIPNLHFWSSGVGKDTLLFFCIALFMYSIKYIKKRFLGVGLAIFLSIFIRPHITLFLLIALGLGFSLDKRLQAYKKIFIFLIFITGFVAMYGYVLQFIQLENFDTEVIENYTSKRVANLSNDRTGSAVNTSSYSFPLKVFTFLYRPLFFDGFSILSIVASFENLVLLLFTIKILVNKPISAFRKANFLLKGTAIFFILGSISFSLILGNLGIMLRQKTPFIISLIIFGYWVIMYNKLYKKPQVL